MANVFGTGPRGCFVKKDIYSSGSVGASLDLPGGTLGGGVDGLLVTSFRVNCAEILLHNKTFGGTTYSYAFGHDPNSSFAEVSFTAFLKDDFAAFSAAYDGYISGRVSSSLALATLVVGSTSISGYVVGFNSGTTQPELNIQNCSIRLSLPEL